MCKFKTEVTNVNEIKVPTAVDKLVRVNSIVQTATEVLQGCFNDL